MQVLGSDVKRMSSALLLPYQITEARAEHDESIERLARETGLCVNAAAERCRQHAGLHIAVTPEDDVLGFVVGWVVADELELTDICVAKMFRRRGLGRHLVAHHLSWAASLGALVAHLEVRASNHKAQSLYRTFGFSEVGRRPGYYSDGEDAVLLRCDLRATPCADGSERLTGGTS